MQQGIAKDSGRGRVTSLWVQRSQDSHGDILLVQLSELFLTQATCSLRLSIGTAKQAAHVLRDGVCVVLNILLKEKADLEAIRAYETALMNSMAMFETKLPLAVTTKSADDTIHSGSDETGDEFDRILTVIGRLGHQHGAWICQSQAVV